MLTSHAAKTAVEKNCAHPGLEEIVATPGTSMAPSSLKLYQWPKHLCKKFFSCYAWEARSDTTARRYGASAGHFVDH
jgi:hypothetical protein